ncbi:hypothetical protein D3C73_1051020 [compost metagenome]
MQLGQERVVRIPVDQLDFDILVVFQFLGELLGGKYATVTSAENNDSLQELFTSFV